jgi:DedD protein
VTEYWIQTASFSSAGKAEEQRAFLSQQGLNAVVSTKEVNGKTYFRVRLGPYSTKREAEGWLTRISSLAGCSGAYVSESVAQRSR